MTTERVDLRGAEATLLMTLYVRDKDARSAHPVLGDHHASDVLSRIDYDFTAFRRYDSDLITINARARRLDADTADFLAAHPDGQVLHLGCGLDSRPLRVSRPATARWLDVDLPDVIELRRRLYDLPPDVLTIGASATDPGWWDEVDADRPTMIVAEGLFMYLPGDAVHTLVDRFTTTFGTGRLAFDGVAPWTISQANRSREFQATGARFQWGYTRREFEARHPALRPLLDRSVLGLAAEVAATPLRRLYFRSFDLVPGLRNAMRVHLYALGAG